MQRIVYEHLAQYSVVENFAWNSAEKFFPVCSVVFILRTHHFFYPFVIAEIVEAKRAVCSHVEFDAFERGCSRVVGDDCTTVALQGVVLPCRAHCSWVT